MKKLFFIIIFFNFILKVNAEIAYIDINFILKSSMVGKSLNTHLNEISETDLKKYEIIEKELIKKEKDLLAQQNIIEKSEFDKKLAILSSEIKKYREDKQFSKNDLNQIRLENTKKILSILNPIITKYVEQNSISIVLPKKNIIVGKKNLDITDKILKLLNVEIKNLNF